MSIRIMTKKCTHCHRTYTYNPSTGNLGRICSYCHWPQNITGAVTKKYPAKKIPCIQKL